MRLSWQNLTDGKRAGIVHGRAWLWFSGERGRCARLEWSHSRHPSSLALEVTTGGGDSDGDLHLHVGLVFASYWFTLVGFLRARRHERTTGASLRGDRLAVQWRCDDSSWNSKTGPAAGKEWKVYLLDRLLGRVQYREGESLVYRLYVPMPEGGYHGQVTMRADSWKRPLWFRRTVRRAHVEMDEGQQIPIPGKGENSWDQGEDGIFGSTFPCESFADVERHMIESAMRTRRRHGGDNWRPSRGLHAVTVPRGR